MGEFQYPQFCALARAAEIVGERWTLLIVRDLSLGPLRFSDLRRRLRGVSSSVLSERLTQLERRGLIERRVLDPPAASTVYELTQMGRALQPALVELMRWGTRFMLPPRPGEHLEPVWVLAAVQALARRSSTPACTIELRIPDGEQSHVVRVSGGRRGTRVTREAGPSDLVVTAEPMTALALIAGWLSPDEAVASGGVQAQGDLALLAKLPQLFEIDWGSQADPAGASPSN